MSNVTKPTSYLNWTDGAPTKVTQPPSAQLLSGWTAGEPIPFQYLNWLFYETDQWIQWLDQTLNLDASEPTLLNSMRLINGGSWTWNVATGVLAWSSAFNIAIASIADADNQAVSGSVTLTDGQVAYVASNVPFSAIGDTTNTSPNVVMTYLEGITVGMTVTGTGIPGSTTVLSIDTSTNTIVLSNNATATGSPTLTFASIGALTVSVASQSALVPGPNTVVIARRVGSVVYVGINATYFVLRDGESKLLSEAGYLNIFAGTAGENLTAGDAVYMSHSGDTGGRTAGRLYKCDTSVTNGATRSMFLGFVMTTATSGNPVNIVQGGVLHGLSSLTAGAIYYADPATPGAITATIPTTTNQWVVPVGIALSTTTLYINAAAGAPGYKIVGISVINPGIGSGGMSSKTVSDTPYAIQSADDGTVFYVDTSGGAVTFNAPDPSVNNNLKFTIIDKTGSFSTNACTLHRNGSEKIENLASDYLMEGDYGRWSFMTNGTDWFLIT